MSSAMASGCRIDSRLTIAISETVCCMSEMVDHEMFEIR